MGKINDLTEYRVGLMRREERKSIENRHIQRNGVSLVQNFGYKVSSPTNYFYCEKTRRMDLLYDNGI